MFGIGETELVIIVVFAFLLFGPDKLPGMGRTLGRVLRQFREASDGFTEVVQTNIMDPASEELEKSPKQRARDAAQATFDEDADVEVEGEVPEPPKRETFAQRRERLKAEREAAQAQAAQDGVPTEDGDGPVPQPEVVEAPANTDAAPEEAPTSAADLYALTNRKSSRALADEAKRQEAAASEAAASEAGEEDGSEEA